MSLGANAPNEHGTASCMPNASRTEERREPAKVSRAWLERIRALERDAELWVFGVKWTRVVLISRHRYFIGVALGTLGSGTAPSAQLTICNHMCSINV